MIRKTLLALPLVAGLLVGCNNVKPPLYGRGDPYSPSQISFAQEDLEKRTAIGRVNAVRPADTNLLTVSVEVRAATNDRLFVQYQATFFDRAGREVDRSAWNNKTLDPNAFDNIQITTMAPEAVDFRVTFRYATTDPRR